VPALKRTNFKICFWQVFLILRRSVCSEGDGFSVELIVSELKHIKLGLLVADTIRHVGDRFSWW
jgi:hypothetical protein